LLRGNGSLKRDALYWHYPHYNLHQALIPLRPSGAIRKGDFKLIEQYEDGSLELYNLRSDIGERFNLAYSNPAKAEELRKDLHAWLKSVGGQMPTPTPENYDPRKIEEWKKARARKQAEAARTQR
jgi:arylsulfatase A-like enzyme